MQPSADNRQNKSDKNLPLWRQVADEVEKWISQELSRQNYSFELPSISSLAKAHGVTYVTMRKAAHHLEQKGCLRISQGRRPRIAIQSKRKKEPLAPGVSERVRQSILHRIQVGQFRPGRPLPKLDRLTQTLDCSRGALLKALSEVEHQGLLHRKGRKLIIGPQRESYYPARKQKIMAVISQVSNAWQKLNNSWTQSFGITFMQEAMASGVTIIPVSATTSSKVSLQELKEEVLSRLYPFNDDWIGTLLVEDFDPGEEFQEFIRLLSAQRRRIIHFGRRQQPHSLKLLVTAKYDANRHAKEGLLHLVRNGHNYIGYQYDETQSWAVSRLGALNQAIKELNPRPKLETFASALFNLRENLYHDPHSQHPSLASRAIKGFSQLIHALQDEGKVKKGLFPQEVLYNILVQLPSTSSGPQMRHWLREKLPGILGVTHAPKEITDVIQVLPFVCNPGITAIILSRDRNIQLIVQSLEYLDLKVPKDLSLVSYDNETAYRNLPVDSIDPGIGNLGYQAFHYLSRDIGIHLHKRQIVYGIPEVIARGSCNFREQMWENHKP